MNFETDLKSLKLKSSHLRPSSLGVYDYILEKYEENELIVTVWQSVTINPCEVTISQTNQDVKAE